VRPKPSLQPPAAPGKTSGGDDDSAKKVEKAQEEYELSLEEKM